MNNTLTIFFAGLLWGVKTIVSFLQWVLKRIWGAVSSDIHERKTTDNVLYLQSLRKKNMEAQQVNTEMLSLSEKASQLMKEQTVEKNEIDKQRRYCSQLEAKLTDSLNDIGQDIAKISNSNFVLRREIYIHIVEILKNIEYAIPRKQLIDIVQNYSGWNNFIKEILDFADVKGVRVNSNEWNYQKEEFCFDLKFDEKSNTVKITAKSNNPISHLPSTKLTNKQIDDHTTVSFDLNNELAIHLTRSMETIDHYDVYEYFRFVDRLLSKKEINEYAGKKRLTIREAFDLEDSLPSLLDNFKKVAPPPADYLPDNEKMHGGKQRWAQVRDIEKAGMLNDAGFVIGKMGYGSYIHTGEYGSHILTIASTGSGKGIGVVVPNLLRHKGSAVVLDPKGENYIITAKRRAELGNRTFYFDPWGVIADYAKKNRGGVYSKGVRATINPFDFIGENDIDLVDKANMIASSLILRESDKDSYFYDGAEQLITRLIIFICTKYKQGDGRRNIIELRQLLTADKGFLLELVRREHDTQKNLNSVVRELYNWLDDVIKTKNRGANDVYHFAQNATSFLVGEQVQESLRESNLDILSIKKNPMSLFLILDMNKLTFNANYYKPLIRLIVTTCMMGVSQNEQPKEKVLFMLDEIAQLGTLQYLPGLLSIYRGKGVVIWTIWQNLSQIKEFYEKNWQTIVGNCDVQQFFGVNDNETAEYVSKLAGHTTIYEESFNQGETHTTSRSETETRGDSLSRGDSHSSGNNTGNSYQGFNYTYSSGNSTSDTTSENYTDSYSFSRSIQVGLSSTVGKSLAKKTAPLLTPFEVTTGNAYNVQFVFYMSKCPFPILSGKIKYFEDKEFYGEYSNNVTRL